MQYQDLIKIIESQQRQFIILQKQILQLADLAGLQENEEFNKQCDLLMEELRTVRRIVYRKDK